MMQYRTIKSDDDEYIAAIVRANLAEFHLDIPGTAYYDPELDHLSKYYQANPERRNYYIALDEDGNVIGGVGVAEFAGIRGCAELQKLYLTNKAKGKGYGKRLVELAIDWARKAGYKQLYLETHTSLETAMKLYEKMGFIKIEKPCPTVHSTMNRFYIMNL